MHCALCFSQSPEQLAGIYFAYPDSAAANSNLPHDPEGLIEILGGERAVEAKLDSLFGMKRYWHGNEPCHQITYLYNAIPQSTTFDSVYFASAWSSNVRIVFSLLTFTSSICPNFARLVRKTSVTGPSSGALMAFTLNEFRSNTR